MVNINICRQCSRTYETSRKGICDDCKAENVKNTWMRDHKPTQKVQVEPLEED